MTESITVTGNIATAPEHKRTPAGLAITTFRVASGQRRYDRETSAWVDSHTNFYTVSTYRGLAEHAFQSLRKGDRVVLTGRLKLREWETDTKRGLNVEIDADAIGHDLRFGTTRFEKDAASTAASATAANQPGSAPEWGTSSASDGWAVPGEPDDARPALVGAIAGDGGTSGNDHETPF